MLELLVALTVFSLLATTVYAGLRTAAASWERSEARIARQEEQRVVSRFIRRQMAHATPLARVAKGDWQIKFDGEADRLVFLSRFPSHLDGGGIFELGLSLRSEGFEAKGKSLVLQRRQFDPDTELGRFDADSPNDRVLAREIESLRISFFGMSDDASSPEWANTWKGQRLLPALVKLEVVDATGEAWQPIVAPTRNQAVRFVRGSGSQDADTDEAEPQEGSQREPVSKSNEEQSSRDKVPGERK